jgi:hypothetical protein
MPVATVPVEPSQFFMVGWEPFMFISRCRRAKKCAIEFTVFLDFTGKVQKKILKNKSELGSGEILKIFFLPLFFGLRHVMPPPHPLER